MRKNEPPFHLHRANLSNVKRLWFDIEYQISKWFEEEKYFTTYTGQNLIELPEFFTQGKLQEIYKALF